MSQSLEKVDLLIVGGGLIGGVMAIAADRAGLSWVCVDKAALPTTLLPEFDGRVVSISYGSYLMFEALGIWPHVVEANPIDDIRVSDEGSPFFLHFDHHDVGDRPFGYMVEARHLRTAIAAALENTHHGIMLSETEIADLKRTSGSVSAQLTNGREVRAALAVGADGRFSGLRQQAGIRQLAWDYDQIATVCVMEHDEDHENLALELFLPTGPFALLPMQGRRCSLVWSEDTALAKDLVELEPADFNQAVMDHAGEFYGQMRCISQKWQFPLSLSNSERYIDQRLVLIGDAAHAMHPIAGQGLNLGLRDIAALIELLYDAIGLGRDLGEMNLLEEYQRWRRFDALTMLMMTDGLNRGFSTNFAPVKIARNLGLGLVQASGPIKQFFEKRAAAMEGDLPKLIRGANLF